MQTLNEKLLRAVQNESHKRIVKLVTRVQDVDVPDPKTGDTPLWWAVRLQVGFHGFVLPLRSLLPFFAVCNHV
jgi:protein-tyrosine-phosphatase